MAAAMARPSETISTFGRDSGWVCASRPVSLLAESVNNPNRDGRVMSHIPQYWRGLCRRLESMVAGQGFVQDGGNHATVFQYFDF